MTAGPAPAGGRPAASRPSRLPGSDELFGLPSLPSSAERPSNHLGVAPEVEPAPVDRRPTGRERHAEKITVYVSNDELLDLEHARLTLKRLGVKADRGRIVREALAELISDLELNGEGAVLVRRLRAE